LQLPSIFLSHGRSGFPCEQLVIIFGANAVGSCGFDTLVSVYLTFKAHINTTTVAQGAVQTK